MNIPGFHAEASLGRSALIYQGNFGSHLYNEGGPLPGALPRVEMALQQGQVTHSHGCGQCSVHGRQLCWSTFSGQGVHESSWWQQSCTPPPPCSCSPGFSCCGPGCCPNEKSCCAGKGCCPEETFCCAGKGCCPDGTTCVDTGIFTICSPF
jgi:hypothetical protein